MMADPATIADWILRGITAAAALAGAYVSLRGLAKIELVRHATNSLMDARVVAEKAASFAEGADDTRSKQDLKEATAAGIATARAEGFTDGAAASKP